MINYNLRKWTILTHANSWLALESRGTISKIIIIEPILDDSYCFHSEADSMYQCMRQK